MADGRLDHAIELLTRFAERTGLTSDVPPRRYLWTDAFAVCAWLSLAQSTRDRAFIDLALRLVEQVHHTLGQHRPDSGLGGWLSGAGRAQGAAHPTLGGLRIGKPLPERRPLEPPDERLEWHRDGQYFHYLTRWMVALDRVAAATGDATYLHWARELAVVAHRSFVTSWRPGAPRRMHWKMSIDLSRPLVASMGQHDPLDGLVTGALLEASAATLQAPPMLGEAIADYAKMIDPDGLATADPLGLGGLLTDAVRLGDTRGLVRLPDEAPTPGALIEAAREGLAVYARGSDLARGADDRLAFRELGLAIGLSAAASRDTVARYLPLRDAIEEFWLEPPHRQARSWLEHEDINDVMLAAALVPVVTQYDHHRLPQIATG